MTREFVLPVVREKVCKNSIRVQAMGETLRPENPSQFYIKNEIMAELGNPAEFEIVLRAK